jgi:hypothetical protein
LVSQIIRLPSRQVKAREPLKNSPSRIVFG